MSEKRKRRNAYSGDEDQDGGYSTYISEERYRAMLGEHVHKYKRRHHNNNLTNPASIGNGMSDMKSSLGLKDRKGAQKIEITSNFLPDSIIQKLGNFNETAFSPHFNMDRFVIT